MAEMIDSDMFFFMRVRRKFNDNFDFVVKKEKTGFEYNGKTYKVRVFSITLSSGEKEILVTNLPGKDIKYKQAGELYFSRWKIETKFDSLKNKLELENMSGRRVVTTCQDFWAKLDLANTMAALEYATDEAIENKTVGSDNKYQQRTNENRLITKFSEQFIDLLTIEDDTKRLSMFDELIADIVCALSRLSLTGSLIAQYPEKRNFVTGVREFCVKLTTLNVKPQYILNQPIL